jgi:hypothetical protein
VSYRLIALFDTPTPDARNVVAHYHESLLKGGRLRLRGADAHEEDDPAPGPLKGLILAARRREWTIKLGTYSRQFERLETTGDAKTVALSQWLRGRQQPLDKRGSRQDIPRDALGLVRDLSNDSEKICSRRTIFLVPDYKPVACADQRGTDPVLTAIADELSSYIDAMDPPDVGFLRLRQPDDQSGKHADDPGLMHGIVGRLFMMNDKFLGKGAPFFMKEGPLLMDGPTGTGKSMAAELIALSQKKDFIKINIAAVTETLLESQMRGHAKGSYSGAVTAEDGWFAKANGGVLFLDEFQSASLVSQTQLLDVLDPVSNDVFINRLGESNRRRFNVKVILATNKPVEDLLSEGRLRVDLFYRIRDIVRLQSFNDNIENAVLSAEKLSFIRRLFYIYRWKSSPYWGDQVLDEADFASLFPVVDASVAEPIENFRWDGNYRQFERVVSDIHSLNDMRRTCVIDRILVLEELEEERRRVGCNSPPVCADGRQGLEQKRLRFVEDLLASNQYNIGKTVEALKPLKFGLGSRQTLRFFLKEHLGSLRAEIRQDSRIVRFLRVEK